MNQPTEQNDNERMTDDTRTRKNEFIIMFKMKELKVRETHIDTEQEQQHTGRMLLVSAQPVLSRLA